MDLARTSCVTAFNVPTERSGCVTEDSKRWPGFRKVGERFRMVIDFADAPMPCGCVCGEYRQYLRGTFKLNGRVVRHLTTNPAGGKPLVMLPRPDSEAEDDNFREDGQVISSSGTPNYGHRDQDPPGNNDDTDRFLPARADGCQYRGEDFPGLTHVPRSTYEIDLDFRGEAVDVCGNAVTNTIEWTVTCVGTLSDD